MSSEEQKKENIQNEKEKDKKNFESEKDKEKEKERKPMYLSGCGGFFLAVLIIFVNIGALVTLIIYINFLVDSNKYNFDKIGFTRLGKNKHFSLCGAFSCVDSWYSSFFLNLIIFLVLFFQEVVISSKWIRSTFVKRAIGDLVFFPKYIIRFMTLFNFSMINMLYQPMNFDIDVYPKLNLTDYFHPAFLLIPFFLGIYLIFSSLHFNLILNDELGFCLLYKIIKDKPIYHLGDYVYGYNIYQKVRSPFRAGVMIIFLSFSPVWDLGRCLYTAFFWFALYIEGVNDERYYLQKYVEYKDYIRRVPHRFFIFDFLFGNKKMKIEEENAEKKEEEKKENEFRKPRRNNNKKKQE